MSFSDFNKPLIEFVATDFHEEAFHSNDLIELEPLGLSVSHDLNKPFLLLRDRTSQLTLPVVLSPSEAALFMSQPAPGNAGPNPHRFLIELLKSLDVVIRQCVFVQIQPEVQLVRVYFTGHPKMTSMKLRADEVISLCVHLAVPLYATRAFIQKSSLMQTLPQIQELIAGKPVYLVESQQRFLV